MMSSHEPNCFRPQHCFRRDALAADDYTIAVDVFDAKFKDFDLVVVPTTRLNPPKINDSLAREAAGAAKRDAKIYDWAANTSGCANTAPFDAYGIPAISLPCGYTKDGLPIGLMIAGPHFTEGKVLALAYAYQQATDWHLKKPPLSPATPVPPIVEGKAPAKAES